MAVVVPSTLFTDFLRELGVPHTLDYSEQRFAQMPFQSLFGLTKLLEEYGVATEGLTLTDKSQLPQVPVPFIAQTPEGLLIVTAVTPSTVSYLSQGQPQTISVAEFDAAWTGTVLIADKASTAKEPHLAAHRAEEFLTRAKKWGLIGGALIIFLYLSITAGIYSHFSTICIAAIDLFGLWLSYLLTQKSLNIHNPAADRVCGVLEAGGCDSVLETKASSFFGLFKWCEVGLSYFAVSLLCLLIFPQFIPWLALLTACCLPFTVWSIWYQKFRAKAWCTMCVGVQSSLWLLFFSYLLGGWYSHVFPLRIQFLILCLTYLVALLGLNRLSPLMQREKK